MRLDKWLAQYGGMSRSEATRAIKRKQVTIDGEICNSPHTQIVEGAEVLLEGVLIEPLPSCWRFINLLVW
jgi:16S rRNA U516 pseudouridylate synthase RsuA-like enzyme